MKKFLISSVALMILSISLLLFQLSCQKTAEAQTGSNYVLPIATTTTLGGVKPDGITIQVDGTGIMSVISPYQPRNEILYTKGNSTIGDEIWLADIDGSNQRKVPISLPDGLYIAEEAALSADGNTIIFRVYTKPGNGTNYIYSCNRDGSNVKKIIDGNPGSGIYYHLQDAY